MPRSNERVAALLQEYADLLSISGGDRFKPRAYEKAARSISGHHADVGGMDLKELVGIPNVGRSIAEKVLELERTGRVAEIEELRAKIPPGVREMMSIPSLGPKKAMLLFEDLGIDSVDGLYAAIDEGRLRGLKGFGEKTEQNLLHGIELLRAGGGRVQLGAAVALAEELVGRLTGLKEVERCTYAGSLRRMRETVGDLDLLVATSDPEPVMAAFRELPLAAEVIASGGTKTSIRTSSGMQVDLRAVPADAWGAALIYFTGSKAHNVKIREIAVRKGLKLNEYGLFRAKDERLVAARTEEEVYERLGMAWIAPTLREDRGEVEAARSGELPVLVETGDIRGDLHTHTDLTDGLATLEQMIEAARARGYRYLAVTDHAPDLSMQRMTDQKMLAQRERLRELQAATGRMRLLHGSELNIGPAGGVDWDAEFLSGFDLTVASVHSHFNQSRAEMTRRLIRACENPHVSIIGHPTARSIGRRPPVDFDAEAVFAAAARTGTAMEVNSYPDRLDLNDEHILWAKRHGVKFAIDTDSHSTLDLANLRFGVATAQRGWLGREDVINAWPLSRLRAFLRKEGR